MGIKIKIRKGKINYVHEDGHIRMIGKYVEYLKKLHLCLIKNEAKEGLNSRAMQKIHIFV